MADLSDMLHEFAHLQEELERQQAQQRAEQRHDQEEEAQAHEDRARRSGAERPGSPRADVVFAVGNQVLHDLLGEAIVRKLARDDDPEKKLSIEWSRPAKSKKDAPHIFNRWVLPSSLKKIRTSPQQGGGDQGTPRERQEGLFGKLPDLAAHERERAAKMKLPEGPRGRQVAARTTKESKVPISQRLREFVDQGLVDSAGMLYCVPCKETLPNIKNSINDHVTRNKHITHLKQYLEKGGDDGEVKELLSDHFDSHPDQSGTRTSAEAQLFRYRTVETFISSGTPIDRVDQFKSLLERSGIALTDCSNLRQLYIPRIQERELGCLKQEVSEQFLGIHFDGTTRLGEAINMIGRWCSSTFEIQQRLIAFVTTDKHCDAPQLASLLTHRLGQLGVQPHFVVNSSRDSAATNGAACNLLLANPYINAANTLCIAHTISNTGERIILPRLAEFTTPLLELVGGRNPHSGAKALWKSMVAPQVVPGYSKVRWWSKAEIWFVMAENFDQLRPFVRLLQDRGYGDATTSKMASIMRDHSVELQLELAAVLDVRQLVVTTYSLEGDRLEVLLVYRRVEELRALGRSLAANAGGMLPNVDGVLRANAKLEKGLEIEKAFPGHGTFKAKVISSEVCDSTMYPGQQRVAYRVRYPSDGAEEDFEEEELRPKIITRDMPERQRLAAALAAAFDYLETRITGTCDAIYDCSAMYEMCRLLQAFDPCFAASHVDAQWVDDLAKVKPLGALVDLSKMKAQLPIYLQRATNYAVNYASVDEFSSRVLDWWRDNSDDKISAWSAAARIAFAISPSSASCERVFALLEMMFGEQQLSALADYVQAALMLRYNKRAVG